MYFDMKRW